MKNSRVLLILNLVLLSVYCSAWGYSPKIVVSPEGAVYMPMSRIIVPNTVEKLKEARKIAKYDSKTNTLSSDYTITDSNRCYVNELSLDPTYTKLAFNGNCHISGGTISHVKDSYRKITIIDFQSKKILATFDHGWLFAFSPNGDAIVYAEVLPRESGPPQQPGFQNAMWIYNFNTKTKIKMNPLSVGATDINWSEHDGNIYVDNYGQVYRYDPKTGKGNLVSYKGINFSPDGKYYVSSGYEDSSRIYRTSDNLEMKEWEKQILGKELSEAGIPPFLSFRMWSKKLNDVIVAVDGKGNVIFDVNQGKVIGVFSQGILGTNADGSLVAVRTSTGKESPPKIEILNLLDLIQPKSGP